MALIFYIVAAKVAALVALVFYIRWKQQFWARRGWPCANYEFFFGTGKGGITEHTAEVLVRVQKDLKQKTTEGLGGIYFFFQPVVCAWSPEVLKNILVKDFNNFLDRGTYVDEENDPLTAHLFSLEGQKWKLMRAKLSPTFTSGKMKMMFSTVVEVADHFGEFIEAQIGQSSELEAKDLFGRYGTDVIGSCAFGLDINSLSNPDSEFRRMGLKVFDQSLFRVLHMMFVFLFPPVAKKLKIKLNQTDVSEFFLRIVAETIEYREKNKINRNDFLDLLIRLKNEGMLDGDHVGSLTLNEIAAQCFVFFLAGFETSSTTLSFCLYELGKNPEVQDRLRNDIKAALAKNNGKLTYEISSNIPYLDQVIDETLRKWPSPTHLFRKCKEEYPVPGSHLIIPKETLVFIPVLGMHLDPENFPDPHKFDPDRFAPENKDKIKPYTYMPFGEGPRNCIGMRFGRMQVRAALVSVLTRYKVKVSSRTKEPLTFTKSLNPLLSAEGGIWIDFEKL